MNSNIADKTDSPQVDESRGDGLQGGLFLSQAGLVTLLLGIPLFSLGVFLDHPTAGAVAFGTCLVSSTLMAAFAPNNLISTITLAIAVPVMCLAGLACLLSVL